VAFFRTDDLTRLQMRMRRSWIALIVLLLAACSDDWPRPPAIARAQFTSDFDAWRADRRERLLRPGSGPVLWVGLYEIPAGAVELGADSSLAIVLAAPGVPRRVGTLRRTGTDVRFEPAPNAHVRLADSSVVKTPMRLADDRGDSATVLATGSLRMRVHGEPGTDRLWLRVWDVAHPARATFTLPTSYAADTGWRFMARLEPFQQAREFRVPDIAGGTQLFHAPGELEFRVGRSRLRLTPFADSGSRDYFVMLWDSTALSTTYEAGRYLHIPFPDSTGWTVIDFNRAYNPPCVFSAYSTCALPPRENRLPLAITAGEKRAK
jgi:uncharacterized protein (DUF1684 family)